MKIDCEKAYEILKEKAGKEIEGFSYDVCDMTGVICWENEENTIRVFATPFYDGHKGIPIEVFTNDHELPIGDFSVDISNEYKKTTLFGNDIPPERVFLAEYFGIMQGILNTFKSAK